MQQRRKKRQWNDEESGSKGEGDEEDGPNRNSPDRASILRMVDGINAAVRASNPRKALLRENAYKVAS